MTTPVGESFFRRATCHDATDPINRPAAMGTAEGGSVEGAAGISPITQTIRTTGIIRIAQITRLVRTRVEAGGRGIGLIVAVMEAGSKGARPSGGQPIHSVAEAMDVTTAGGSPR